MICFNLFVFHLDRKAPSFPRPIRVLAEVSSCAPYPNGPRISCLGSSVKPASVRSVPRHRAQKMVGDRLYRLSCYSSPSRSAWSHQRSPWHICHRRTRRAAISRPRRGPRNHLSGSIDDVRPVHSDRHCWVHAGLAGTSASHRHPRPPSKMARGSRDVGRAKAA